MKDRKSDRGSLYKGIALLNVAGEFPNGARFSELAKRAQMSLSTTHRILATLVDTRMLEYSEETRLYTLGLGLFELTSQSSYMRSYHEVAHPVMRRLSEETESTVSLNVFDDDQMVVLERADPRKPIQLENPIGSRETMYSTASGKIVLASLDQSERETVMQRLVLKSLTENTITDFNSLKSEIEEVRRNEFALSVEENEIGVNSVAVLIPLSKKTRIWSLAILAPSFLASAQHLKSIVPQLRIAASEIGSRLGAARS